MAKTKELTLQKELSTYETAANALIIKTNEDLTNAVSMLSNIGKVLDKVTEEKEKVTKPLNEVLKAERARWKPIETACETAMESINKKMSAFRNAVEAAIRLKEAAIEKKVENGQLSATTASRKLETLETGRPQASVSTTAGRIVWRTGKKVEIVDINLIPKAYWLPNEVLIRKDALAGTVIPGVRVVEETTPANFR